MNDDLVTEALAQHKANPDHFAFRWILFWHRSPILGRNRWNRLHPKYMKEAMEEPMKTISMDHWPEPKFVVEIPSYLSLWGVDAQCRLQLGFKPIFLEIKEGQGRGTSREQYGEYKVICPSESMALLYAHYDVMMIQDAMERKRS